MCIHCYCTSGVATDGFFRLEQFHQMVYREMLYISCCVCHEGILVAQLAPRCTECVEEYLCHPKKVVEKGVINVVKRW